jgi:two-component system, cell cycle response regulator DivK
MADELLIIEDNEQNYYMMRYLLEHAGYAVAVSDNGRDGIALARQLHPRAILLDIQLPEMDGYAVAAELKGSSETADIPIVVVTSYAMPEDRERSLAAGADGYIEKPIDPDTFIPRLMGYVEEAERGRDDSSDR